MQPVPALQVDSLSLGPSIQPALDEVSALSTIVGSGEASAAVVTAYSQRSPSGSPRLSPMPSPKRSPKSPRSPRSPRPDARHSLSTAPRSAEQPMLSPARSPRQPHPLAAAPAPVQASIALPSPVALPSQQHAAAVLRPPAADAWQRDWADVERTLGDEYWAEMRKADSQGDDWEAFFSWLEHHVTTRAFESEWAALDQSFVPDVLERCSVSLHKDNHLRNRYVNVVPYDSTRVRLTALADASDYINASYIASGSSTFIAAQAPNPDIFQDFYRMVWESGAPAVVMLTRWYENGTKKADNYLPISAEQPLVFPNGMRVSLLALDDRTSFDYETRTLKLSWGPDEREILHFNYVAWPDYGVPEDRSVLDMLSAVDRKLADLKAEGSDVAVGQIVHCSAGIGRTGTWIATSTLLKAVNAAFAENRVPQINVMRVVHNMRQQRMGMVQSLEQFSFIYKTLLARVKHLYISTIA
eukprot:TRINITY_DN15372_c0_g1_i1.p1 TRINITY_DN15372_c0_g1~~TRINITY_DN15372_c0_g1_i1.p1  ORF type:complete len:470 (+),score=161.07 TRINITY_DN15372_c0_g1_i1:68-1477(+)